jgi:hypothetical protein
MNEGSMGRDGHVVSVLWPAGMTGRNGHNGMVRNTRGTRHETSQPLHACYARGGGLAKRPAMFPNTDEARSWVLQMAPAWPAALLL